MNKKIKTTDEVFFALKHSYAFRFLIEANINTDDHPLLEGLGNGDSTFLELRQKHLESKEYDVMSDMVYKIAQDILKINPPLKTWEENSHSNLNITSEMLFFTAEKFKVFLSAFQILIQSGDPRPLLKMVENENERQKKALELLNKEYEQ